MCLHFFCLSGDKKDEECTEMADELYQIMVIYSLYKPSLLYFTDTLHVKIGCFLMRKLPIMCSFLERKPQRVH